MKTFKMGWKEWLEFLHELVCLKKRGLEKRKKEQFCHTGEEARDPPPSKSAIERFRSCIKIKSSCVILPLPSSSISLKRASISSKSMSVAFPENKTKKTQS